MDRDAATARLTDVAEALALVGLVVAPWPFGCAPDAARYALAGLLLAAWGLWAGAAAVAGRGVPAVALPAAGLPALALVQAASGSSVSPVSTLEALLLLAAMLGAFAFWRERARDRAAALRLATALLATCAAQALFGAVQWSLSPGRIYGRSAPLVTTPFGSFVNHNHFAGLAEMGVLVAAGAAVGHAWRGGGLTPGALALSGLGLGLTAAHLASRSRGGLLALAAGAAVLGVLTATRRATGRRRRLAAATIAAVAVLGFGLAVIPPETRSHLGTILHGAADASGSHRLAIAGATLRLAASHPLLGAGLGAYADAVAPFKTTHGEVRTTHAESDALEILAESGLLGLLGVGALAWAWGGGLADRLRHGHDPLRIGLALGAAAGVASLAVHSLFDFNLRLPSNALAFASLAGLAASPRSEERPRGSAGHSAVLAAVATVLAAAAAWRAAGAFDLESALGRSEPQGRLSALDHTLARHPYLAEAHRARGLVWRDLAVAGFRPSRLARAERDLDRAVGLRRNWGEAWGDLGWVRFAAGDRAGADSALARAVALDPTHLGVSLARADMLGRTGRIEDAMAELRRLRGRSAQWSLDTVAAVAAQWTLDVQRLDTLTDGSRAERDRLRRRLGLVEPGS